MGRAAEIGEELAVVKKIFSENDRGREDVLSVRYWKDDVLAQEFAKLDDLLGMA